MAVSFANVQSSEMELTPMRVDFQAPGATDFTDLGGTLGNVLVSIKYKKADIKADQMGDGTVLDRRVSGLEVTVTTELAEIKDIATVWTTIYPIGTLASDSAAMTFTSQVGNSDLANAGILRLHPLSIAPASDTSFDYYFWKACASAESEITYSSKDQAKMKIVWNVLPDFTTTPARFAKFGNFSS